MSEAAAKEEKKRKKMLKKMRKILMQAWNHPGAEPFQSATPSLQEVGEKVEKEAFYNAKNHRQGWEDFARDLGIVFNHHIAKYVLFMNAALFLSFSS